MFEDPSNASQRGPLLLCAGTDPAAAARLADAAVALLADRPAIVLATWQPPPLGGFDSLADALYDAHIDLRAAARDAAIETAGAACDALSAHGLKVTRRIAADEQSPWQSILEHAERYDVSVIVAGTSDGRASHDGELGSQARALAHRARRPLLLVPAVDHAGPVPARAPAIFAYDGSVPAQRALDAAAALLRPRPAVVTSVWHTVSQVLAAANVALPAAVARKGAAALDDAASAEADGLAGAGATRLSAAGWPCQAVTLQTARGVPAAIIDEADERDAAILVSGTRGRSQLTSALLGSSAEALVRYAGRPVLLVPAPPR
jgi:nucleotide-binding universal stress UspA family protein